MEKTTTNTQMTAQEFNEAMTKELDHCVEKIGIRDAFEHWNTQVFYGSIRRFIEGEHLSNDVIKAIAKEYRLKLENEVKRQTLDTLEDLKDNDHREEAINYYNWHREYADYIALI